MENPGLHLTALYLCRRSADRNLKAPKELQELQEEILADYGKGTYLAPFNEENGVPLLKQQNGDSYQRSLRTCWNSISSTGKISLSVGDDGG
mgnify:CR=1 FL=1